MHLISLDPVRDDYAAGRAAAVTLRQE